MAGTHRSGIRPTCATTRPGRGHTCRGCRPPPPQAPDRLQVPPAGCKGRHSPPLQNAAHPETPGRSHRFRRPHAASGALPHSGRRPPRRPRGSPHCRCRGGRAGPGARCGALAGEPAPGAAAPRLAGLRGAAEGHLLGAGVRAASCGKGLRRRRLTAGPRPLPSWRARARAGVCAPRRGKCTGGEGASAAGLRPSSESARPPARDSGRRPPGPLAEGREGEPSPRAEAEGVSLRPLRGVRASASPSPRLLKGERARRFNPDTKGAGPLRRASGTREQRGAGPREAGLGEADTGGAGPYRVRRSLGWGGA